MNLYSFAFVLYVSFLRATAMEHVVTAHNTNRVQAGSRISPRILSAANAAGSIQSNCEYLYSY